MEISNENLMKILKHQNEINQLIMRAFKIQPAIEEIPTQPITVSKDGVPLPRLLDKIKNIIGVNFLTVDEIMEMLLARFPKLIKDIKVEYQGQYITERFITYDAHKKLKTRVKNCLNYNNNFIFTYVNIQKKYANITA